MTNMKDNIDSVTGSIGKFTRSLKDAEDAVGKFFALGSESSGRVGGMTKAFDDLAKATTDVSKPVSQLLGVFESVSSTFLDTNSSVTGFMTMLKDSTVALGALPGFAKDAMEVAAGVFDGPTRTMREFDAEIFNVGKRFGDSIESSKDFADAINRIPASDFGDALSMTRGELQEFYRATERTNLTQEQLNTTITTGIGQTNLLGVATAFAASSGMNASTAAQLLNTVINKQGVEASEAADMMGVYAGVARDVGLQIDDVASSLNSAVQQFGKLGVSADFGAPVLQGFGRVVKDMGLGIEQATSLTGDLSGALGRLTEDYSTAYVLFERGGLDFGAGGGALGASIGLQAELLKAERTGDQAAIGGQLVGALRDTIASFSGGNIVTVSEAAESPEMQTQFYTQQQLLVSQFGLSQSSATRTLELLAEIDDATRAGDIGTKEELEKQLQNEIEGRDKTLDLMEQANRELAAQSNLLAVIAREPLEAMQAAGFALTETYVNPAIESTGSAAQKLFSDNAEGFTEYFREMARTLPTADAKQAFSGEEQINKAVSKGEVQAGTPGVDLTNKELAIVADSLSSAIKDGLNEDSMKNAFEAALISAFAQSGRDMNKVKVEIDFADPATAGFIKALMKEVDNQ